MTYQVPVLLKTRIGFTYCTYRGGDPHYSQNVLQNDCINAKLRFCFYVLNPSNLFDRCSNCLCFCFRHVCGKHNVKLSLSASFYIFSLRQIYLWGAFFLPYIFAKPPDTHVTLTYLFVSGETVLVFVCGCIYESQKPVMLHCKSF